MIIVVAMWVLNCTGWLEVRVIKQKHDALVTSWGSLPSRTRRRRELRL
jgi:hypothetical protein